MKRLLASLSGMLLAILCTASPAHASLADWLDKLEKMSGPGPFHKWFGASFDFLCFEGQSWPNPETKNIPTNIARDRFNTLYDDTLARLAARRLAPRRAEDPLFIADLIELLSIPSADTDRELDRRRAADPRRAEDLRTLLDGYQDTDVPVQGFRADAVRLVAVLEYRLRVVLWRLREELLASNDERDLAPILKQRGLTSVDIGDFERNVLDAFNTRNRVIKNFACVGDLRKPRTNIGVSAAWFSTGSLPTEPSEPAEERYVYEPSVAALSPVVNAYPLAVTVERTLPRVRSQIALRSFDYGGAVGAIFFNAGGKQKRFNNVVTVPYWEAKFTARPLAWAACPRASTCPGYWTAWDLLETEFVVKGIGGVKAEDFGARPGPSSKHHVDFWLRVGLSVKFNRDQTPSALVRYTPLTSQTREPTKK